MSDASAAGPTVAEPDVVRCPQCDYDLRGIDSGRCPECGAAFDRDELARSSIPWDHRQSIGRFRAFWRTVGFVTFNPSLTGRHVHRPIDLAAAQRFRWITICFAYLGPAVLLGIAMGQVGAMSWRVVMAGMPGFGPFQPLPAANDWVVPWWAGVTLRPVAFSALLMTIVLIGRAADFLFRSRQFTQTQQNAASTLSHYTCAPLAFLPIASILLGIGWISVRFGHLFDNPVRAIFQLMGVSGRALSLFSVLLFYFDTLWIHRRATRMSNGQTLAVALILPSLWLGCAVAGLGIFPWLVGLVRIVFASFR